MKNKYFGTDGVRGLAGEKLTPNIAYRIGRYIGQYPNGTKNRFLIARDTRISGQMLLSSLVAGILASGSEVFDLGVSTTPSVSYLVRKHNFDYGVMISASHNPFYDNGIKIFNREGEKLENEIEFLIEGYIDSLVDDLPIAKNNEMGIYHDSSALIDEYVDFLVEKSNTIQDLKVLADCANGSASVVAPKLFARLGVQVTFIHAEPNGININDQCGSTHMEDLQEKMKKGHFDIGLAFDGDADRLLLVGPKGNLIDGDAIMYLSALNMRDRGKLNQNKVVATVMSNLGLKVALKKEGIEIEEVQVGDKYVQAMLKEKNLSLGGEQSGHVIYLQDLNTGDGLLTAIKILKTLYYTKKTIDELVAEYHVYPQKLVNVKVVNKEAVIAHQGLKTLIREQEAILDGNGRILVRPSGTENLVRVMVEANRIDICERICDTVVSYVKKLDF